MKTWYTRDLSASCFCIGPDVSLPEDDYRYRILLSGCGGVLLPCTREDVNGAVTLRYDISGALPLSDLVRPYSLRFPQLLSFAELLLTALGSLPDCLLAAGDVLLGAPYLFVNVSLTRLRFVLYPWEQTEGGDPLASLFLSLFPLCDPEDDDASLLLFRLYNAAAGGNDLPHLLSVLRLSAERHETRKAPCAAVPDPALPLPFHPAVSPVTATPAAETAAGALSVKTAAKTSSRKFSISKNRSTPEDPAEKKEALRLLLITVPSGLALSFLTYAVLHRLRGITLPLTGILAAGSMLLFLTAVLLFLFQKRRRKKDAEPIPVSRKRDTERTAAAAKHPAPVTAADTAEPSRIDAVPLTSRPAPARGTETTILEKRDAQAACLRAENAVMAPIILPPGDHRIGKSGDLADVLLSQPGISRLHAELTFRDGEWYLKDLGSRNGTMLGAELLPPNTPVLLTDRDRISFGGLVFTFLRAQSG